MILRGASVRHAKILDKLLADSKFEIAPKHLISSGIIEDDSGTVIAAGTLSTIVEASILINGDYSVITRAKALKLLLKYADEEITARGYDNYHVFTTNDSIKSALLRRDFKPANGDVLVKWGPNG